MNVFMDAHCLIAANLTRDVHHKNALAKIETLEVQGATFVTTDAVLIEFCNMLSKAALRPLAARAVREIYATPAIEVVHVTKEVLRRAHALFEQRNDKEWGLTDCISFEVMRERKISSALTADHHFTQAGFKILL